MTKVELDIHKEPERFSHEERATELCNYACGDIGMKGFKDGERICGLSTYDPETAAYLEGFFAAVAFMSGTISGGKVRHFAKWMGRDVDLFQMVNIAAAVADAMEDEKKGGI